MHCPSPAALLRSAQLNENRRSRLRGNADVWARSFAPATEGAKIPGLAIESTETTIDCDNNCGFMSQPYDISRPYDGAGGAQVPSSGLQQRQQTLEQLRRARRTAADMQIDGHDGGHPADHRVAAGKQAAVERAVADRHH